MSASLKIQTASGTKRSETREEERNLKVTVEDLGETGSSLGVCWKVITYYQGRAHLQLKQRRQQSWNRLLPPAVYYNR